jgi:hypothetical protein
MTEFGRDGDVDLPSHQYCRASAGGGDSSGVIDVEETAKS